MLLYQQHHGTVMPWQPTLMIRNFDCDTENIGLSGRGSYLVEPQTDILLSFSSRMVKVSVCQVLSDKQLNQWPSHHHSFITFNKKNIHREILSKCSGCKCDSSRVTLMYSLLLQHAASVHWRTRLSRPRPSEVGPESAQRPCGSVSPRKHLFEFLCCVFVFILGVQCNVSS